VRPQRGPAGAAPEGAPSAGQGSPPPRKPGTPRWLPRSRAGVLALCGVVLGVVFLGLALADRGGGTGSAVSVRPGSRAAAIAAGAASSESPLQSSNYVSSIDELHRLYGEPPDATLGRLRIPSLKIDAPLSTRPVPENGQMPNPAGPDDIAYYDFSGWRGYGGFPTAGGNAVFAGHVDQAAHLDYAGLDYLGPGVFFRLQDIDKGDTIELDVGNGPVKYRVRWVREVEVDGGDWKSILGSSVSIDSITLITCGGDYSTSAHAYSKRTVVRAERS
jgi:LPXTG-site transpeptidase (sortase) family protein